MKEPTPFNLIQIISQYKKNIFDMPDSPYKEEFEKLLYFLEELQLRRELDNELPWEIKEIIDRFKIEYFYTKPKREKIAKFDWTEFLSDNTKFDKQKFTALKGLGLISVIISILILFWLIF